MPRGDLAPGSGHLYETACADCGTTCYSVQDRLGIARCELCAIAHHGAIPPSERVKGERPRPRYLREGPGAAEQPLPPAAAAES